MLSLIQSRKGVNRMTIDSFYPVLLVDNLQEEVDFFKELFGFSEIFTNDWYVSLKDASDNELAVILKHHETIPETHQQAVNGLILNVELENVDDFYKKVIQMNLPIVKDIKSEDFGQRHFIIESPSGTLVDVIQVTSPSEEHAESYTRL